VWQFSSLLEEAIEILKFQVFDLILLDLTLPDGKLNTLFQLLKKIAKA
jgi:CheY-like chemotaxis protein